MNARLIDCRTTVAARVETAAGGGFIVLQFRAFEKNTLRGFLSLELPSGMILHGCTLHEKNGSRWVGVPAKEYEKDGTKTWAPLVEFTSKEAREKFQACALAAFDAYMGEVDA
jgi:hypothetical protein